MQKTGLKPATKIVLYWIAESYDATTDEFVVGINQLATLCEISRKCVQTHLRHLKKIGLISVSTRHHVSRAQDVNAYKLGLV
jgi:pyocin large subunit-like protein